MSAVQSMQQNKSLRDAAHRLMPVVSTYKVVHDVGGDFTSDDEHEVLTVYMYAVHSMTTGPIYADMTLPDRKQLKFQINVIQKHVDCSNLMDSHIQLRMYNNSYLRPLGKWRIPSMERNTEWSSKPKSS